MDLGKIIDKLTFASICVIMNDKDVKYSEDAFKPAGPGKGQNWDEDINTDENMAGSNHLHEDLIEENQTGKLRDELLEQKEKYLRLVAEFDNFRKRTAREKLELMQTAGKEVITSMLDVLDDCDRAEKELQKAEGNPQIRAGVLLVFNKLRNTLQARGLKAMESIHQEFDVEKHESITEIEAPGGELKGKVLDEITKGYYLNDKIIRFAKVVVGK